MRRMREGQGSVVKEEAMAYINVCIFLLKDCVGCLQICSFCLVFLLHCMFLYFNKKIHFRFRAVIMKTLYFINLILFLENLFIVYVILLLLLLLYNHNPLTHRLCWTSKTAVKLAGLCKLHYCCCDASMKMKEASICIGNSCSWR